MAFLKTKYPCTACREPCLVRRRRDADRLLCRRCAEVRRLKNCAGYACEESATAFAKARGAETPLERAAHLAEAIESAVRVGRHSYRAAELSPDRSDAFHLCKVAESWMDWASRALAKNGATFAEARTSSTSLAVLDGLGAPPETDSAISPPRVALTVVHPA